MSKDTAPQLPVRPSNWSYDPRADKSCRRLEAMKRRTEREVKAVYGATLAAKAALGDSATSEQITAKARDILGRARTSTKSTSDSIDPTLWALLD